VSKAKSPSEWTAPYRHRMEAAYAKNPYASKTEARGHGLDSIGTNEAKISLVDLKQARGSITRDQAMDLREGLIKDRTQENIKVKISNVDLREDLGVVSKGEAIRLRTELKGLGVAIKNQYENLVVGTRAYHAATEGIKASYDDLYMQGIIGDAHDDPFGDIFYH
jgi:hypothetical protein